MKVKVPVRGSSQPARLYFTVTAFRVDRAVSVLVTAGTRPVVPGEVVQLASLVVAHTGEQFVPIADRPPTVGGTAEQDQTLIASSGAWSNTPTLAFQWQRCDSSGASCTDVPGATGVTYVITAADAGGSLRVVEKGTNRFGAASSQSEQTAVVPAAGTEPQNG
jgi:hypothetical protein